MLWEGKIMKKQRCLMLIVTLFAMFTFSGCSEKELTKSNMTSDCVYSSSLGTVIQLGMEKSQVDKLLGEGELGYEYYVYQPDSLTISYKDGRVYSIALQYPNTDWKTKEGFGIGTAKDDIISAYGNTRVENDKNELIYGFDSQNKLLPSNNGASYGILYMYGADDKVKIFTIMKVD
jgi:hypothetical protein